MPKLVRHIYTMLLVIIGWVLFSFDSFKKGADFIAGMFGLGGYELVNTEFIYLLLNNLILLVILAVTSTDLPKKCIEKFAATKNTAVKFVNIAVLEIIFGICVAYLVAATYNPFLYFRF